MGTLRDEVYEGLDYLSQLTEVVVAPQNEVLAKIPDRRVLSIAEIQESMYADWQIKGAYALSSDRILSELYRTFSGHVINQISSCFELQPTEDLEIDFETGQMKGSLALVKIVDHLDEKKLLELAVADACGELDAYGWPRRDSRDRGLTVMNILEDGSGNAAYRSPDFKKNFEIRDTIRKKLEGVISDNKWRIRDTSIIVKMGTWINAYMSQKSGDVGLVNLMKLKFMKDKDLPIYSIDEVQNVESA